MPKDEFDFADPLELNGVALYTERDTQQEMAECFIEEFIMLHYGHEQLLALFRNPHYVGLNMVLQNKGEPFVKDVITQVFARWGRKISWSCADDDVVAPAPPVHGVPSPTREADPESAPATTPGNLTDPLGNALPPLNL